MNVRDFSKNYTVRKLLNSDIDAVYELCKGNPLYYACCPPSVTHESIAEDMAALPPGITADHKYYVGYFREDTLIAVMDFIDGYPEKNIAYIGFFMCHAAIQNRGIGTAIIQELLSYAKAADYQAVQLGWVKGNPQAEHFWIRNGFKAINETVSISVGQTVIRASYALR